MKLKLEGFVVPVLLLIACASPRSGLPSSDSGAGGAAGTGGASLPLPNTGGAPMVVEAGAPDLVTGAPEAAPPVDLGVAPAVDMAPPVAVDMGCVGSACPRANSAFCTTGTQCLSGNCVDGVCCDKPCDGVCYSCGAAGFEGTCTALLNKNDAPLCSGSDTTCVGAAGCATIEKKQDGTTNCNASLQASVDAIAQSFTVTRAGRLAGIQLNLGCAGSTQLHVTVHAVTASGPGQELIRLRTVVNGGDLVLQQSQRPILLFKEPLQVSAGDKLAYAFRADFGTCHYDMYCSIFAKGTPLDTYKGGQVWIKDPGHGIPNWQLQATDDMMFDLLVLPP